MKVFAVLSVLVLAASASPAKQFTTLKDLTLKDGRIIQGSPAQEGQFPWQVAVNFVVGGSSYFCGGALISDSWVLTAAHCADGASSFTLRFGSTNANGGTTVSTTEAVVNPGYNQFLNNDVALVKLPSPIEFTPNIQPIRLPQSGDRIGVGETLRVSGWGKTSDNAPGISSTLNYVDLNTISNNECAGVYGGATVIASTLCCRGNPSESTCNGDSGGPLTRQDADGARTHVGVVSFVHINGCASGNPSGYVRTESMLSWIQQTSGVTPPQ